MSTDQNNAEGSNTLSTDRRVYEPPRIASTETYERFALSCTGTTMGMGGGADNCAKGEPSNPDCQDGCVGS